MLHFHLAFFLGKSTQKPLFRGRRILLPPSRTKYSSTAQKPMKVEFGREWWGPDVGKAELIIPPNAQSIISQS